MTQIRLACSSVTDDEYAAKYRDGQRKKCKTGRLQFFYIYCTIFGDIYSQRNVIDFLYLYKKTNFLKAIIIYVF
jgi:hypothetical protein